MWYKIFTTLLNFKKYIVKLPIKKMNELLPKDYAVAKKRLGYLQKQL